MNSKETDILNDAKDARHSSPTAQVSISGKEKVLLEQIAQRDAHISKIESELTRQQIEKDTYIHQLNLHIIYKGL